MADRPEGSRLRRGVWVGLVVWATATTGGCGKPEPTYEETMRSGMEEFDRGQFAEALGMFRVASELDRERPEPSFYMGRSYLGMADRGFREDNLPNALLYCDRAASIFDSAIAAFPGYTKAVQGKADALKLKGKHEAAQEISNWAAKQSGPRAKMLRQKARQYAQGGDMDKALLTYVQATSVEPENPAPYAELGLFYMRCGNDAEAIRSLRKARELDPKAPGVDEALRQLGVLAGRPVED